ncbi:MAG: hypothetical protein MI757_19730 [Pirellulales bacterium]|nr:hypothetical protein [Pirellulales bacterium]
MTPYEMTRARHVEDVRAFADEAAAHLDWSRDRVLEEQRSRLRRVVAHAQESSPFYAKRLGQFDASKCEVTDLAHVEPLTKAAVMDNWDQLVTDDRLRLAEVNEHLERLHRDDSENAYLFDQYYAAATGGTSGKRGVFLWDWETFIVTANICFRMDVRHDRSLPPDAQKRTAVICAGSLAHGSRFLFPTPVDPAREVRVLPAGTPIRQMVADLNAYQPDRIIGYASIVEELAAIALDGDLQIRPTRIATNSEPLLPEARAMAQDAWGINVHNSWGSVEIGLAATEGDDFGGVTLAEDFLIFEPVDADHKPVAEGEQADRVLVTKLFGTAMPLIRYEMTDTLVIDNGPNPDAPGYRRVTEVKGRADAWFVYEGGVKIHPMVFRSVLGQDRHISEYQVQQTPDGVHVLAITHGQFDPSPNVSRLRESLSDAGMANPAVSIQCVGELPRHPQTNKLKRFVPLS